MLTQAASFYREARGNFEVGLESQERSFVWETALEMLNCSAATQEMPEGQKKLWCPSLPLGCKWEMGHSWGLAGDCDLETSHINARASIKGFHGRDAELAPEVLTEWGRQLLQAGGQLLPLTTGAPRVVVTPGISVLQLMERWGKGSPA